MPSTFDADSASLPSAPFTLRDTADERRLAQLSVEIANRAVKTDVQSEGVRVNLGDGLTWWDTRPMTDPHEHAPESIDMFTEALQFAVGSGLASLHPQRPYLITFSHRG